MNTPYYYATARISGKTALVKRRDCGKEGMVTKIGVGAYEARRFFGSRLVKVFQASMNDFCINEAALCSEALRWCVQADRVDFE